MIKHFTPSTNILSSGVDYTQYLITTNVQSVFDSIISNYRYGIRSINLIGAYGTGKSTFLAAFESHIQGEKLFLDNESWKKHPKFEVIKFVGEYKSLVNHLSEYLACDASPQEILKNLEKKVYGHNKAGKGVLLIVDEFGKFLEYASKNDSELELYFLQQLAEYANNESHEFLFITTLHQDFSAYAATVNKIQRNEWAKVKGRFKEISFNEPVEQLIYLASKRLHEQELPQHLEQKFNVLFNSIKDAKAFPLRDYFTKDIAKAIYPLDILSSALLALSLQQYGQNERSLFTFLDSYNYLGLQDFKEDKFNFYSIKHVYDYLNHNFNSFLKSKANPDYTKWASIRIALERVEGEFDYEQHALYQSIIKTIGLLNIFSHAGARLDETFLIKYIECTSNFKGIQVAIKELDRKKIIRFTKYAHRYILFDSSEVDIDVAIDQAGSQLNRSNDIVNYLSKYFSFPTVSAKKAYFEKGTPRIFQFKISENPYHSSIPKGQIDGFINLIFNTRLTENYLKEISKNTQEAILFGLFKNAEEIKGLIEEIQKAEIVKERHLEDRIVQREINQIIDIQKHLLNHYVLGSFYDPASVIWYFGGQQINVSNSREFNSELSKICNAVYTDTPIFKSELANKTKLSPAVSTARKSLIHSIIYRSSEENLGILGSPPEKSIYMSLLKETAIHKLTESIWCLGEPVDDNYSLLPLFKTCDDFVQSSKGAKRTVSELYDLLSKRPFKLKKGFLDFWIPIYLYMKNGDFALYGKHGFVPDLEEEVLELVVKNPLDYSIKAFDVGGVKIQLFNQYRHLLNLNEEGRTSNTAFIQTIVPFIKFHKDLPDFAKNTKRLSKKTIKIRQALTDATDPEKLFFEDFPNALGFDIVQLNKEPELLNQFSDALKNAIRELRSAYEDLLERFECIILSLWNKPFIFLEYKDKLRARYSVALKQHLLLPYQKTFHQRLCSPLEDRNAWLSSISQSVIGKTLDKLNDQEEIKLHEAFLNLIHELDNLNDIAIQDVNLDIEDVFKLEISSPGKGLMNKIIRLPKEREQRLTDLENQLGGVLLNENRFTKIAILAELLKKELDNE